MKSTKIQFYTLACLILGVVQSPIAAPSANDLILLNQSGYMANSNKVAIVNSTEAQTFSVVNIQTNQPILMAELSQSKTWPLSEQSVKVADFSAVTSKGIYEIRTNNNLVSYSFPVGDDVYDEPLYKAAKSYYLIRSGQELKKEYAGEYARPLSHDDTQVYIHRSAASQERPENTIISSSKGWYDAGDYNKYIVNSSITVYTLLAAIEDNAAMLTGLNLNIPESRSSVADLVFEVLWNLDWMLTMQDPNDGGVYHKLTTKNFTAFGGMPHEQNQKRYVVAKSTTASLDFAAVMSYAHRVLTPYESHLPRGYLQSLLESAEKAWRWSNRNPLKVYVQPEDIATGQYSQPLSTIADEWSWAATELFLATDDNQYLSRILILPKVGAPSWSDVNALALMSLASNPKTPVELQKLATKQLQSLTDEWVKLHDSSAYRLPLVESDFVWGSNAVVMNKAFVLIRLNKLIPNSSYIPVAQSLLDYVMGRNPFGKSYITGVGHLSVVNIHHRISVADSVTDPLPGLLSGGPFTGQSDQDDCAKQGQSYESNLPALSFLEQVCSYASNETAINWNAPLVYVLSGIQSATQNNQSSR